MLTATSAPSREQCSHSPVLGKCVYLEWSSILNSIYEITIYLWVILKYLSPHLPSLIYSASSGSRSINGKLLIMLSEMLKRLLRVKGILLSRGTKKQPGFQLNQGFILYIDKGYFCSSQGRGAWWLAHSARCQNFPVRGLVRIWKHFISCSVAFKWLANQFFNLTPPSSRSRVSLVIWKHDEEDKEGTGAALQEWGGGGHKQSPFKGNKSPSRKAEFCQVWAGQCRKLDLCVFAMNCSFLCSLNVYPTIRVSC